MLRCLIFRHEVDQPKRFQTGRCSKRFFAESAKPNGQSTEKQESDRRCDACPNRQHVSPQRAAEAAVQNVQPHLDLPRTSDFEPLLSAWSLWLLRHQCHLQALRYVCRTSATEAFLLPTSAAQILQFYSSAIYSKTSATEMHRSEFYSRSSTSFAVLNSYLGFG